MHPLLWHLGSVVCESAIGMAYLASTFCEEFALVGLYFLRVFNPVGFRPSFMKMYYIIFPIVGRDIETRLAGWLPGWLAGWSRLLSRPL